MTEHRLLELLGKHNLKVATAESCTGGLVAGILCDISGISAFFEEGYITYSERAKIKNLGVATETIETFGVVSLEVAEEMAKVLRNVQMPSARLLLQGLLDQQVAQRKIRLELCVLLVW